MARLVFYTNGKIGIPLTVCLSRLKQRKIEKCYKLEIVLQTNIREKVFVYY